PISVDAAGNVFIADTINGRVVKVTAGGVQTTVATGTAAPYGIALGVPAAQATTSVSFQATVQTSPPGGVPTGTVTFTEGATTVGRATLSGTSPVIASLTTSNLSAG